MKKLKCGSQHRRIWGHNGYFFPHNHWCKKAFAYFRYTGQFLCKSRTGLNTPVRMSIDGNIQCLSKEGKNCILDADTEEKGQNAILTETDAGRKKPKTVTCGAQHKKLFKSTGFESDDTWCRQAFKALYHKTDDVDNIRHVRKVKKALKKIYRKNGGKTGKLPFHLKRRGTTHHSNRHGGKNGSKHRRGGERHGGKHASRHSGGKGHGGKHASRHSGGKYGKGGKRHGGKHASKHRKGGEHGGKHASKHRKGGEHGGKHASIHRKGGKSHGGKHAGKRHEGKHKKGGKRKKNRRQHLRNKKWWRKILGWLKEGKGKKHWNTIKKALKKNGFKGNKKWWKNLGNKIKKGGNIGGIIKSIKKKKFS